MRPGTSMPVHHVRCLDCGKRLRRKTYWREPRCYTCRRKRTKGDEATKLRKLRLEARRYRILMALSPYDSFEELLAAVRLRQPRTRSQRFDLALEQRRSA